MCEHDHAGPAAGGRPGFSRRRFIYRAALGTGLALASTVLPFPLAAAGKTDALLLTCMDYRLMDDVARYMQGRGLNERYDHVILAGASLGVLNERSPAWGQTFWEHVQVAIDLHRIPRIIVLDHRDCGAYRVLLGPDHAKDAATERDTHAAMLRRLRDRIVQRHPALAVELLLMDLDGRVEAIG